MSEPRKTPEKPVRSERREVDDSKGPTDEESRAAAEEARRPAVDGADGEAALQAPLTPEQKRALGAALTDPFGMWSDAKRRKRRQS